MTAGPLILFGVGGALLLAGFEVRRFLRDQRLLDRVRLRESHAVPDGAPATGPRTGGSAAIERKGGFHHRDEGSGA